MAHIITNEKFKSMKTRVLRPKLFIVFYNRVVTIHSLVYDNSLSPLRYKTPTCNPILATYLNLDIGTCLISLS